MAFYQYCLETRQTQLWIRLSSAISYTFSLAVALISGLVLVGWYFNIETLTRIQPDLPAMQTNTALGLGLSALAILFLSIGHSALVRLALALCTIVALIGILSLAQYVFGWEFGIDHLLHSKFMEFSGGFPGRPSPPTSVGLLLIGSGLIFTNPLIEKLTGEKSVRWGQGAAIVAGILSFLLFNAHIFGARGLYDYRVGTMSNGVALHTAFSLALLSVALLFRQPNKGLMSVIVSDTRSGVMARRILTTCIFAPPLISAIMNYGMNLGWYGEGVHDTLIVVLVATLILRETWKATKVAYAQELRAAKIQEALTTSEEKFRGLLESAQDAVLIVDRLGRISFSNNQVCNWFGYSASEIIGEPIEILIPERFRPSHPEKRDQFLRNPVSRNLMMGRELFARRKNGSEFPVDIALSPSMTRDGPIVTAVIRDVSEQRRREGQFRFLATASSLLSGTLDYDQTVANLASVVVPEAADACVVRLLVGGQLQTVACAHRNSQLQEAYLRMTEQIPSGGRLADLLYGVCKTGLPLIETNFQKSQSPLPGAAERVQQFGREVFNITSFAIFPLKVGDNAIGTITFVADESQRHFDQMDLSFLEALTRRVTLAIENARLYREAHKATRAREEILAIVSHDLRNPIGAISLALELIQQSKDLSQDQVFKFSEIMQSSVGQARRLIDDLQDFVRIEAKTFSVEKRPHYVPECAAGVLDFIGRLAKEKSQQVVIEFPPELPEVLCDADRMSQVIANLAGNAIKFTPPGGSIRIVACAFEKEVLISVIDNGPGIEERDLPRIFDRYYQAESTKRLGTGLGLAISKAIVEAHGGRIWAESRVGHGSKFHFTVQRDLSHSFADTAKDLRRPAKRLAESV